MLLGHLQFRALPTKEQIDYSFTYGTYLACRPIVGFGVHLYHLNDFFCEVWVCQTFKEARLTRTFTSAGQLAPYADLILLPPL